MMGNSNNVGNNTQSSLDLQAERLKSAYRAMTSTQRGTLISRIQDALGGQSYYAVYNKILKGRWPNRQVEIAIRELEGMTNNC